MKWFIIAAALLLGSSRALAEQQRVAVFVGVNSYPKPGFSKLQYAERDVELAATEFKKFGFKTVVMKGSLPENDPLRATRKNVVQQIETLMAPLDGDDICVVMLSGHGHQFRPEGKETEDAFYCPVDAVKTDVQTMLSLSYVIDTLLDPHVGHKLLLVDACRDAPKTDGSKGIQGSDAIRLPSKTAVLFSCSAKEQSFETNELGGGMGTFSYCLLDGLRGSAMNADGLLTWTGLVAHVENRMESEEVRKLAPRQNPVMAGNAGRVVLGQMSEFAAEREYVSKSTGMKLALIPAGQFWMGTNEADVNAAVAANQKEDYFKDEHPQHQVRITKSFYLARFEVTQAEFRMVMGRNPSHFSSTGSGKDAVADLNTDRFPVESVSWFDAVAFCNALSAADGVTPYYDITRLERDSETQSIKAAMVRVTGGSGYHLPTEAEWEYACRGGTKSAYCFGFDAEALDQHAWFYKNAEKAGEKYAHAVGQKKGNSWGLHDMHGNVWEWCGDWYDRELPDGRDPQGPSWGDGRVIRGGSWDSVAVSCRSASRSWTYPLLADRDRGFRVALSPSRNE